MIDKPEIANIILHVIFISSFIGIFFFTYVSYIEELMVKSQVAFLIDDVTDFITIMPQPKKNKINIELDKLRKKIDLSKEDKKVKDSNNKLLLHAFIVILVILIIGMAIVYWMSCKYGFNFVNLLKHNMFILCFVALTEFVFITFYARYNLSIDVNLIKRTVINRVSELAKKASTTYLDDIKKSYNQLINEATTMATPNYVSSVLTGSVPSSAVPSNTVPSSAVPSNTVPSDTVPSDTNYDSNTVGVNKYDPVDSNDVLTIKSNVNLAFNKQFDDSE